MYFFFIARKLNKTVNREYKIKATNQMLPMRKIMPHYMLTVASEFLMNILNIIAMAKDGMMV